MPYCLIIPKNIKIISFLKLSQNHYGVSQKNTLSPVYFTVICSHADGQALGEVCHRLVDVFLWQLFPDDLQSDFQLIDRLEFMVLYRHGAPDAMIQWVQIWKVWGPLILFNEPRTVRLQPVLREACSVSWLPA